MIVAGISNVTAFVIMTITRIAVTVVISIVSMVVVMVDFRIDASNLIFGSQFKMTTEDRWLILQQQSIKRETHHTASQGASLVKAHNADMRYCLELHYAQHSYAFCSEPCTAHGVGPYDDCGH